jgi:hypothetical protein
MTSPLPDRQVAALRLTQMTQCPVFDVWRAQVKTTAKIAQIVGKGANPACRPVGAACKEAGARQRVMAGVAGIVLSDVRENGSDIYIESG